MGFVPVAATRVLVEVNNASPEHKGRVARQTQRGACLETAVMSTSLSAGGTGDEIPHGEDIHNVPIHIDVPRESDRPVHGEDLSTLLAQPTDVPPTPGESAYMSSEGVYIGEGLPPVPAKLARKIRAGEFIEMDELLPEVWTMKKGGEPEPKRRCGRFWIFLDGFSVLEFMSVSGACSHQPQSQSSWYTVRVEIFEVYKFSWIS